MRISFRDLQLTQLPRAIKKRGYLYLNAIVICNTDFKICYGETLLMKGRSTTAILLLVFFALSFVAPLVVSGSTPDVPSCCQRHGAHHCMMDTHARTGRGLPGVKTHCRCELAGAASLHSSRFRHEARQALASSEASSRLELLFEDLTLRDLIVRSHRKRDPPLPLS